MDAQFWVIEGTDGTGKSTQAELLANRLRNHPALVGRQVERWHFPHYDGHPWGTLIKEYLAGNMGLSHEVDPHYSGLIYAADRGQQSPQMHQTLANGNWLVADRYLGSNMAHQGSLLKDLGKRDELCAWLENLEFGHFAIPRPTGTIVLNLPRGIREERLRNREGGKDILEQNLDYQADVNEEYLRLADTYGWKVVSCVSPEGEALNPQEIAVRIWDMVMPATSHME